MKKLVLENGARYDIEFIGPNLALSSIEGVICFGLILGREGMSTNSNAQQDGGL